MLRQRQQERNHQSPRRGGGGGSATTLTSTDPIVAVWHDRRGELARWAFRFLVNRRDAWGTCDRRGHVVTKGALSIDHLMTHFAGTHLVGLHTTNCDDASRWLLLDVDNHEEDTEKAQANVRAVKAICAELIRRGLGCLVEDSDGQGGFHVWVLFDAPAPTAAVFPLGQEIAKTVGGEVEAFPKQPTLEETEGGYGNWVRLPGRHPTRAHWSKIMAADGTWLEGHEAIDAILAAPLNPVATLDLDLAATTPTEKTENTQEGLSPLSVLSVGDGSSLSVGTRGESLATVPESEVAALVKRTIPTDFGQRRRCLLKLARILKFEYGLQNGLEGECRKVFDRWHTEALRRGAMRETNFDTNFAQFVYAIRHAECPPEGDLAAIAFEMAKKHPCPAAADAFKSPEYRLLVAGCAMLQRLRQDRDFSLSVSQAALYAWGDSDDKKVFARRRSAASEALRSLEGTILQCLKKGIPGRPGNPASRFRYLPQLEELPPVKGDDAD